MKYWKYAIKIIVYVYEFCNFSIIFFSLYLFKPVQLYHVFSKKNSNSFLHTLFFLIIFLKKLFLLKETWIYLKLKTGFKKNTCCLRNFLEHFENHNFVMLSCFLSWKKRNNYIELTYYKHHKSEMREYFYYFFP